MKQRDRELKPYVSKTKQVFYLYGEKKLNTINREDLISSDSKYMIWEEVKTFVI